VRKREYESIKTNTQQSENFPEGVQKLFFAPSEPEDSVQKRIFALPEMLC